MCHVSATAGYFATKLTTYIALMQHAEAGRMDTHPKNAHGATIECLLHSAALAE